MNNHNKIFRMVLSALFIALAYVLPFFTGQIAEIGSMLCPMHIPVLLCGFICGWYWGFAVGLTAPLLRSLTLGMPVLFPMALAMSLELAAYGAISGIVYKILPRKKPFVYLSLIVAMLLGRLVWGVAMFTLLGISGSHFTFSAFFAGAITNAIPGIILQIALVPALVIVLDHLRILRYKD